MRLPALLWHVFVLVCADDAASEAARTGPDRSDKPDVEARVAMIESDADYLKTLGADALNTSFATRLQQAGFKIVSLGMALQRLHQMNGLTQAGRHPEVAKEAPEPWNHAPSRQQIDAAPRLRPGDVSNRGRINVGEGVAAKHKLVRVRELHPGLVEIHEAHNRMRETREIGLSTGWSCQLLKATLEHVYIPGRVLTLDDLIPFSHRLVNFVSGGFNHPHWDPQWAQWPDMGGYQTWYLLRAANRTQSASPSVGNLILVEKHPEYTNPPMQYTFEDGRWSAGFASPGLAEHFDELKRTGHTEADEEGALAGIARGAEPQVSSLRLRYVDAAEGDCLIMGKRHLHLSDPRAPFANRAAARVAAVMRVVIRNKDGTINVARGLHGSNDSRTVYQGLVPLAVDSLRLPLITRSDGSIAVNISRHEDVVAFRKLYHRRRGWTAAYDGLDHCQ